VAAVAALAGVTCVEDIVLDGLGGWDGRGGHGEGQDGEEVGELHFGLLGGDERIALGS
jgi:hypothetical protein